MDARFFTTAPVAVSWGAAPEFTDFRGLESMFAIRRSNAYTLISEGEIESVVLRRRGTIKGRRLINVASVRRFLAKQTNEIDPAMSANCRRAQKMSADKKRRDGT